MNEKDKIGEIQMRPLVSVIMPAYNAEKYIGDAIRSVIAQTYEQWELLIFDDCSTDETAEIAEHFAAEDSRVCLLRNPRNMGAAKTRNRGLDLAKGQWIALLDSDDIWHKDKLEKQLAKAEKSGADIVYTSYSLMNENSEHLSDFIVPEFTTYDDMLKENVIGCSTVLARKSVLQSCGFSEDHYHEDYILWLELLKAGHRAVGSTELLTDYRVVKGSRSSNKLKAAKNRWLIYRKAEKLPLTKAIGAFAAYAFRGIVKYRRV